MARLLAVAQPESGVAETASEESIAVLKSVVLFEEIAADRAAIEFFASVMDERRYEPGVDLLVEGSSGSEMFILLEGQVSVYKKTPEGELFKVAILQSADHAFFGEGGLIHDEQKTATIRSDSACRCLVLSRAAFEAFGEKHPEWALPFYRRISASVLKRLRKANDDLMLLYKALVAEIRG